MKDFLEKCLERLERVDILKTIVCFTVLFVFVKMSNKLIDHEIPEANREILIHVLGIIEGAVVSFVSFYFGSSKGSQRKDQMLAESLPKDTAK